MNRIVFLVLFVPVLLFSQELKKAKEIVAAPTTVEERRFVRNGNELYEKKNFVDAEVQYKKVLATNPNYARANYNAGNAIQEQNRFKEAIPHYEIAAKVATEKPSKASAYHNMGNAYFGEKNYASALEAYKNALKQNPRDEESRYNYALTKKLLEQQQNQDDQKKDKDKDQKEDQNKDQQKDQNKDQQKDQNKDQQDQNKEDQQQQPKDQDQKEPPKQPNPNQLSQQQMEQLLDAMNNEENKTQKKINAKEAKGQKVKKEKDW
jgi:Ca-activated chloride channel family protein